MKSIEIVVKKGGKLQIEAHGYQGEGCEADVQFIAEKLKGETLSSEHKPEYFVTEQTPGAQENKQ